MQNYVGCVPCKFYLFSNYGEENDQMKLLKQKKTSKLIDIDNQNRDWFAKENKTQLPISNSQIVQNFMVNVKAM